MAVHIQKKREHGRHFYCTLTPSQLGQKLALFSSSNLMATRTAVAILGLTALGSYEEHMEHVEKGGQGESPGGVTLDGLSKTFY